MVETNDIYHMLPGEHVRILEMLKEWKIIKLKMWWTSARLSYVIWRIIVSDLLLMAALQWQHTVNGMYYFQIVLTYLFYVGWHIICRTVLAIWFSVSGITVSIPVCLFRSLTHRYYLWSIILFLIFLDTEVYDIIGGYKCVSIWWSAHIVHRILKAIL